MDQAPTQGAALVRVVRPGRRPARRRGGPGLRSTKRPCSGAVALTTCSKDRQRSKAALGAPAPVSRGGLLGLLQTDPTVYLQAGAGLDEAAIQAQIQARADAKKTKNFAEADRIRNDLLAQGIVLKDSATGTTWEAAP